MSQSYHRSMDFTARQKEDAARVFDGLMRGEYAGLDSEEGTLLEDYLVFECCRAASDADLTVQFHQGIRAGNYGSMEGCTPARLLSCFRPSETHVSISLTPVTLTFEKVPCSARHSAMST